MAKQKARYVVMTVYVFSGPNFAEHEECFAGWMTRDNVNSNEVYEPKTVENKIDMRSESKNAIPVIFDLKERKAIWVDVTTSRRSRACNNVENNKASIADTLEAFVSLDNKISLKELFELHTEARGELTEYPAEADTVFSLNDTVNDNDKANIVTPFDITKINSDFVV